MHLALDTSTSLGSVALGRSDGEVAARRFLRRQGAHASALVPAIRDVLQEIGVERSAVGGVVVGAGPGSFTGVRVAAATAKGLVRSLEVPLWAVSSLAAAAATVGLEVPGLDSPSLDEEEGERPRYVLFDARGERVYAASYRIAGSRLETVVPPHASRIGAILDGEPRAGTLFCGSGARRHRDRIEAEGFRVLRSTAGAPSGDGLLRILALDPDLVPLENPGRWEPEYLRAWKGDRERKAG